MLKKTFILCILVLSFFLTSCVQSKDNLGVNVNEKDRPDKLVV